MAVYVREGDFMFLEGHFFAVSFTCRDWTLPPGLEPSEKPPSGKVWVVSTDSLPDELEQNWATGYGESREEALNNFKEHVKSICNFGYPQPTSED